MPTLTLVLWSEMPISGTERWEDWFDDSEKLLWQGAPESGVVHWIRNIFLSAFGLPFLFAGLTCAAMGISYIVELGFGNILLGVFLAAFSVPFVGIGGGMVFGPWVADYVVPKRTRYALTTKAGYAATQYWGRNMDVFPIRPEIRIELAQHRNGLSTIHFHFEESLDSDGDLKITKKGFTDIADGEAVYRLIRDVQSGKGMISE